MNVHSGRDCLKSIFFIQCKALIFVCRNHYPSSKSLSSLGSLGRPISYSIGFPTLPMSNPTARQNG